EWRQGELAILESQVGGLAQRARPRTEPAPEGSLRVRLKAPFRLIGHRLNRGFIILEKRAEHIGVAHLAERLRRGAELNEIVRRSRRRAEQAIFEAAHELGNAGACRTIEILQNAGFIA